MFLLALFTQNETIRYFRVAQTDGYRDAPTAALADFRAKRNIERLALN